MAQLALTYSYNFPDQKYQDYVSILSVLAQASIDSTKRTFDVDITEEINRIKDDMDITINKYPTFWKGIKEKNDRRNKNNPKMNPDKINKELRCPMNELSNIKFPRTKKNTKTLPMSDFFIKHPMDLKKGRRKSRKVEDLIEKYSLKLLVTQQSESDEYDDYFLLRYDFQAMVDEIRRTYISKNYLGLMSWLIDRAFLITENVQNRYIKSTLYKNRSLLFATLYAVNPEQFLKCFARGCTELNSSSEDGNQDVS